MQKYQQVWKKVKYGVMSSTFKIHLTQEECEFQENKLTWHFWVKYLHLW